MNNGDTDAFAAIYNQYWQELTDFAYKRLNTREDAEEVVQDVFVALFERRQSLDIRTNLAGYLKSAVRFRVYNKYREWISRGHFDRIAGLEDVDYHARSVESLEYKELEQHLNASIARLPDKCRQVFLLSRQEKLSNKRIAEKLGISVSTVEKHIGKALTILKGDLNNYDMELLLVWMVVGSAVVHSHFPYYP